MVQLEKLLGLLSDVDSFYSYIHEAQTFPSLEAYFTSTSPVSKAADYDPRALDADCVAAESTCAALAARLRLASMACEEDTVPADSFEGQPTEPLPGLSYVLESINTYPRGDGLTTSVSCSVPAGDTVVTSTTDSRCATNE